MRLRLRLRIRPLPNLNHTSDCTYHVMFAYTLHYSGLLKYRNSMTSRSANVKTNISPQTVTNTNTCTLQKFVRVYLAYQIVCLKLLSPILRKLEIANYRIFYWNLSFSSEFGALKFGDSSWSHEPTESSWSRNFKQEYFWKLHKILRNFPGWQFFVFVTVFQIFGFEISNFKQRSCDILERYCTWTFRMLQAKFWKIQQ